MHQLPRHPSLYEINTRVWLNTLSRQSGRKLTLGTVPQENWDRLKDLGMDLVWLMGVWLPSLAGRAVDCKNPELQWLCQKIFPDFTVQDLVGSPYAVAGALAVELLNITRFCDGLRCDMAMLLLNWTPGGGRCRQVP